MRTSVNAIPDLLNAEGIEDAYIAGGYVRDVALGVTPKDVDVFIPGTTWNTERFATLLGRRWYTTSKGSTAPLIVQVLTNKTEYSFPVQLILMTHLHIPSFVEDYFDWGLCKCFMNVKDQSVHFTSHFKKDDYNKVHTFKYNKHKHNLHTAMAHGARLHEKYPWPMRVENHV